MILIIDNYDSFVYNLSRYVAELGHKTIVARNDAIDFAAIADLNPSHIILSPGPCTPNEAGVCVELVKHFAGKIPILGVCLGHQAIASAFNVPIIKAQKPLHGRASMVSFKAHELFAGMMNPFQAGRYHSLIVDKENLHPDLEILAESEEGEIMALAHKRYALYGVQFHPESILTPNGKRLLENFINQSVIQKHAYQAESWQSAF